MTIASSITAATLALALAVGGWTAGQVWRMAEPARDAVPTAQADAQAWVPVGDYLQAVSAVRARGK